MPDPDKQIDLEQTEYRREPRKNEPFFAPGAGTRIKWFAIMFAISTVIGIVSWFIVYGGIRPFVESFY